MSGDERTPTGDGSAVSVRVTRDGWRAHVPAFLLVAIGAALNGGTCSKQDEVLRRIDDLATRVARIEGGLSTRVSMHGAEGAGGTAAPD
jgi:hypothetical protein